MEVILSALEQGAAAVTANNRLAVSITLAYDRRQRTAGHRAWRSPTVLPWRAWQETLWSQSLASGAMAGEHVLLTDFQTRAVWQEVVLHDSPEGSRGNLSAVAEVAERAWAACQNWRVTPADLAAEADSADTQLFARWAAAYFQRCQKQGWADPDRLTALLIGDVRSGKVHPPALIQLAGFEYCSPLQEEFLSAVAVAGSDVQRVSPRPAGIGGAVRITANDPRHEFHLAARWARRRIEMDPGITIGVVVPDLAERAPEVRREFLDIFMPDWRLAPAGEMPVNFSYGQSLAQVGLVHIALLALDALRGRLDYRNAGVLLRTPYLAGAAAESGERARLDLQLREQIGADVDLAALAVMATKLAPRLAASLQGLLAMGRAIRRTQDLPDWAANFRDALSGLGWPGDRALNSDEYQAALAWQKMLENFRNCGHILGMVTLDGALGLLRDLARSQVFQPQGRAEAVQVLGVIEALGQQFDALWICGLTSEAWPPAAHPNPLLPLSLQRRLAMPYSSPPLTRRQAERRLRWLMTSASDVIVSSPSFAGEEQFVASPLIASVPEHTETELELWPDQRLLEVLMKLRRKPTGELATLTVEVTSDAPPPVGAAERLLGGAQLLERQARCPARAFLEFRLAAAEMRAPTAGIDARTRGAVTHAVLEAFFRRISRYAELCQLSADQQTTLLEELISAELARQLPLGDPVIRRIAQLERQRLVILIGKFLALEREREGFVVEAVEPDRRGAIGGLEVKLRPDRMDRLPNGELLIIDYKTGQKLPGAKELWGYRPRSPQLPLYATLADAQAVAFVALTSAGVKWMGVGRDGIGVAGIRTPLKFTGQAIRDWTELRYSWRRTLEHLAHEISGGDFRIDRWHRDPAEGQWAMATRIYEFPDDGEDDADADEREEE